jgi:hypothetical protein
MHEQLLSDWSHIIGGCNGNQACMFLDGVLRILQVRRSISLFHHHPFFQFNCVLFWMHG